MFSSIFLTPRLDDVTLEEISIFLYISLKMFCRKLRNLKPPLDIAIKVIKHVASAECLVQIIVLISATHHF